MVAQSYIYKLNKNMKKSEIFAETLSIVSEATEIEVDDILSDCRREEVVEARALLVYVLSKADFKPACTAHYLECTKGCVYYHLRGFDDRLRQSKMLEFYRAKTIQKLLKNNLITAQ